MPKRQAVTFPKPLLGDMPIETFLREIWQRHPQVFRAVYSPQNPPVTRQTLFRLACQPVAESRLVRCDAREKQWHSVDGPFTRRELTELPASHWTLLVQAVDQVIPDLAGLLPCFSFLPRWRLDDIMVSVAAKGGGVGPHFDYYDVFLLQVSGQRRWQLGDACDETTPLRDQTDLKLLKRFQQTQEMVLVPGDMLYLPAGIAHWGTALTDDCITVSIGFRAASTSELLQIALGHLLPGVPDHQRYRDTRPAIDSDAHCINAAAVRTAAQAWKQLDKKAIEAALRQALGEYATEPRCSENIVSQKSTSRASLRRRLQQTAQHACVHHPASRFAYHPLNKAEAELYVDGECHRTTLRFARQVCHGLLQRAAVSGEREFLVLMALMNQGSLTLSSRRSRGR